MGKYEISIREFGQNNPRHQRFHGYGAVLHIHIQPPTLIQIHNNGPVFHTAVFQHCAVVLFRNVGNSDTCSHQQGGNLILRKMLQIKKVFNLTDNAVFQLQTLAAAHGKIAGDIRRHDAHIPAQGSGGKFHRFCVAADVIEKLDQWDGQSLFVILVGAGIVMEKQFQQVRILHFAHRDHGVVILKSICGFLGHQNKPTLQSGQPLAQCHICRTLEFDIRNDDQCLFIQFLQLL